MTPNDQTSTPVPPPSSPNSPNIYPAPVSGPMAGFDPSEPIRKPKPHVNPLLIPLILSILFLLIAIGFGVWAFMSREDYKSNFEAKAAVLVAEAEKALDTKKEAEFAEEEKNPLKEYKGSPTYGSVVVKYPKTWSAFITETDGGAVPIDAYMHPNFVPGLQSGTAFALHFQVTNTTYEAELTKFDALARTGKVSVTPISVPKVPDTAGVRITGEVEPGKQGTAILFPVRDKTLKITTQAEQFNQDLNDNILPNLEFVP